MADSCIPKELVPALLALSLSESCPQSQPLWTAPLPGSAVASLVSPLPPCPTHTPKPVLSSAARLGRLLFPTPCPPPTAPRVKSQGPHRGWGPPLVCSPWWVFLWPPHCLEHQVTPAQGRPCVWKVPPPRNAQGSFSCP